MITRMRRNPAGLHLALMLALTFSTGVIDAVGYLGLDRVFTGNMTGNVVILGMALTGANDLPIVGPIIALVLFMTGAAVSGRTLRHESAGWHNRSTALFSVVGLVLVAAAVPMLIDSDPAEPIKLSVTGALGLAMGLQAGAARHIGVKDVTTVVVTSTIVGLAYDSVFAGRSKGHPWPRRVLAIALIGVGAAVGALLLQVSISAGILVAAGITLLVALVGHLGRPAPAAAAE
ncbi:YoaK family protein [Salinibacterium sp. G-O1]|uniref:YoaK family protein n=1 Tax=Salinibacterium sp. G-O1 TaxID=3046208 RepID=UPI0024BAE640|nr:YoaK family protein [Salinibacterium sp. G-O1]MDJ0335836.1 YoaK family protein [Salinibacterium sp. G-O1]